MRSEFEFIQHIKKTFSLDRIGDDCAILPKDAETDMVVTADMLVDEIDFRLEWTTPEQLGWKVLAVSLSDIAAMGAEPRWSMLSIAVPQAIWSSSILRRQCAQLVLTCDCGNLDHSNEPPPPHRRPW